MYGQRLWRAHHVRGINSGPSAGAHNYEYLSRVHCPLVSRVPARALFRVLVSPDALYFIRLKGLISASDAGSDGPLTPRRQAAVASLIRKFAAHSLASGLAEVDAATRKR